MELIEIIKNEFTRRMQRNPSYSLRGFARDLGVDASNLSKILKSKKKVSSHTLIHIAPKLGLSVPQLALMLKGNHPQVAKKQETESSIYEISPDLLAVIMSWEHYAILELMRLEDFRPDAHWIAKKIGVSKNFINLALDRLQSVGLLKINGNQWVDLTNGFSTHYKNSYLTSYASRAYEKQLLDLAIKKIDEISIEQRDQSSLMVAMNRNDIPKVKKLIKNFRRQLSQLLRNSKNKDSVYQLLVSFYPLTVEDPSGK